MIPSHSYHNFLSLFHLCLMFIVSPSDALHVHCTNSSPPLFIFISSIYLALGSKLCMRSSKIVCFMVSGSFICGAAWSDYG